MDSEEQSEYHGVKPAKNRDFVVLAVVAAIIIGAFILLTFKLIDQEDTHVRNVEKVKMAENFSYDEIGNDEAEKSVNALVGKSGLRREGDFSTLNLTDDLMKKVATIKEMEILDVAHTKITNKSVEYMVGLPLRELDLSADAITDEAMNSVAKIPTLKKLTLTETGITDAGIAKIAHLPRLVVLIAAATKITDKGVAALVSAKSLDRLDVTSTSVTDQCLKDISKIEKLEVLLADSTKITGAGVCKFLRSPMLRKVFFAGCRIEDADILGFPTAMPSVNSIDLSSTQLTDRGLSNLAKWKHLENLKVRNMVLSGDAKRRFHTNLPSCKISSDSLF